MGRPKFLKLTRDHKSALRSARRIIVENHFVSLPEAERSKGWLLNPNRYRIKCTSQYEKDARSASNAGRPLTLRQREQLVGYVSASSPAHVVDGWSLLGRGIDATMRGDTYSAMHFAYYAELRAAMSLLASEGVGIFDSRHPILGVNILPFPRFTGSNARGCGTHRVVWPVFRFWSGLKRAETLLNSLVMPEGRPLGDWLLGIGSRIAVRAIAKRWLTSWGLDLSSVNIDRDVRNMASYRPSEFRMPPPVSAGRVAQFANELWAMFEPGAVRRFPNVEVELLKSALRSNSLSITAENIERIGFSLRDAKKWEAFLKKPASEDPLPIQCSISHGEIDTEGCHMGMLSRAALLLFIASGSARTMLQRAEYTQTTLQGWWKRHGEERGLWNASNCPDDPLDAWEDIVEMRRDLAKFQNSTTSIHELRITSPRVVANVGAFELVGIWSLLP